MPIPFRRTSKTRKAKRRTHQNLNAPSYQICSNCGSNVKNHSICKECGFYKGKQVIKIDED